MTDFTESATALFFEKSPFLSVELIDAFDSIKGIYYLEDYVFNELRRLGGAVESYGCRNLTQTVNSYDAVKLMLRDRDFLGKITHAKQELFSLFLYGRRYRCS